MRRDDIIQDITVAGMRYVRILTESFNQQEADQLRSDYQHAEVYCFAPPTEISGFQRSKQATYAINLTQGPDRIFANFHSTTRNQINKVSRNSDVTLKLLDPDEASSYELYAEVKKEDGANPDIRDEFVNCIYANAYLRGSLFVTITFYDNGVQLRLKHIASLRKCIGDDRKFVAHATRAIIWKLCEWASARGRTLLDLGGANFTDPAKAGITQFKGSFGGDLIELSIYRYDTPAFAEYRKQLNASGVNIL